MSQEGQVSPESVPRVSYAQNGEDVLLDRLFGAHVGTYMDIGACHPIYHNNAYFFYLRGWRGVNVEPIPWLHSYFEEHRPEDLNLAVAAGASDGDLPFFELPQSGGLSTLSAKIAEEYRARGEEVVERLVPVRTVAALVAEHAIAPPDFLSIDAEGTEEQVVRGLPLDRWRPRAIVVESTWPETTIPSHEDWEPFLLEHGYLFAAFNGVNRFYLRDDLRDRLACFERPVNVLDQYTTAEVVELQKQIQRFQQQEAVWQAARDEWQNQFHIFDRQRDEFRRKDQEFQVAYAEFAEGYAGFQAGYAEMERQRLEAEQNRPRRPTNVLP